MRSHQSVKKIFAIVLFTIEKRSQYILNIAKKDKKAAHLGRFENLLTFMMALVQSSRLWNLAEPL